MDWSYTIQVSIRLGAMAHVFCELAHIFSSIELGDGQLFDANQEKRSQLNNLARFGFGWCDEIDRSYRVVVDVTV